MSDVRIIPSAIKYPSAPNTDQSINIDLGSEDRNVIEYDKSINVNLQDVYNKERQSCYLYRPTFKVSLIYDNFYYGSTDYEPLKNNLYYINPELSLDTNIWSGYPQYYEFDFHRPQTYGNIDYEFRSGYTYNWSYYITYPYSNDYNKKMGYSDGYTQYSWIVSDGIPFKMTTQTQNGVKLYSFVCVCPHNLSPGEFVKLPFYYQSGNTFQVFSLGNNVFGSEEYIFNIVDIGFTGSTFYEGKVSTFKRKLNNDNPESLSRYYIKRHKVLETYDNLVINKIGFEKSPFPEEKKLEYPILTPNNTQRVSQKNSSNSYSFTLKRAIDVKTILDNQNRPLSELFLTIVNTGYYGLFNKPKNNIALKKGWSLNITKDVNYWWSKDNLDSDEEIEVEKRLDSGKTFYWNKSLSVGDLIDGDFCEWNDIEQKETVLSKYYHRISYNEDVFNIQSDNGFYYSPHIGTQIKVFSDYIEESVSDNTENIPNWAFYSKIENKFIWRDMYDIGFIDNDGNGVDYPFLNNSHYPFNNSLFRLFSDGSDMNNEVNNNFSGDSSNKNITIDNCE